MDFIVKNYVLIIVVVAFIIFAIIGYIVDSTKNKKNKEGELLTRPNDDNSIAAINNEQPITQDVTSAPDIPSADSVNMNMDNK